MLLLAVGVMVSFLYCFLLISLSLYLSWVSLVREKSCPFECGFEALTSTRSSFSIRFFMTAILFVVFDVEVVLLLPGVILVCSDLGVTGAVVYVVFLIVLLLGCFYERRDGSMDWVNES